MKLSKSFCFSAERGDESEMVGGQRIDVDCWRVFFVGIYFGAPDGANERPR